MIALFGDICLSPSNADVLKYNYRGAWYMVGGIYVVAGGKGGKWLMFIIFGEFDGDFV